MPGALTFPHGHASAPATRHITPQKHHANPSQMMHYATTTTKTNSGCALDQLDPVETLPTVCMAPLGVGLSPLVGTESTLGAYPGRVQVLRPQTRGLGANATGAQPFLGDILHRVAEMVE